MFIGPGFFFGFIGPLLLLALVVLLIAAVVGRRQPDPRGRRPYALYLLAVMFVSLFATFGAVFAAASVLVREVVSVDEGIRYAFPDGRVVEEVEVEGAVSTTGEAEAVQAPGAGATVPQATQITFTDLPNRTLGNVLEAASVGLPAALLLVFHHRRLRELARKEAADG